MPAPSPLTASDPCGVRRLITVEDRSREWPVLEIGNAWSRRYYGGPFHLFESPESLPAISLVFVQSRDGNTAAGNPGDLGGGPTDKYLIYEGLSRVAADGVMAGAGSVGKSVFFKVMHPELITLRRSLGLPQHPAQIVMSEEGHIDLSARIYSQPHVPVFLLAGRPCVEKHALNLRDRPWITMIPIDGDLAGALTKLRQQHGIARLSCVGGRTLATALVDAGFVQDLYLTTSPIEAGEPNTPWYAGDRPPRLDVIARKHEDAPEHPIVFEHLAVSRQRDRSCLLSDRARADRPERREWSMRTVRNVLAVFLSVSLALPVGARAQHPSVVDQAMLDRVLATRVMHADADRLAIRALLEREQVREIAAGAGIDITRASAAVATLDGAELQQLAGQARVVDEALAGGQGTVTLKTTTIIIGLLVLILLILVLK